MAVVVEWGLVVNWRWRLSADGGGGGSGSGSEVGCDGNLSVVVVAVEWRWIDGGAAVKRRSWSSGGWRLIGVGGQVAVVVEWW